MVILFDKSRAPINLGLENFLRGTSSIAGHPYTLLSSAAADTFWLDGDSEGESAAVGGALQEEVHLVIMCSLSSCYQDRSWRHYFFLFLIATDLFIRIFRFLISLTAEQLQLILRCSLGFGCGQSCTWRTDYLLTLKFDWICLLVNIRLNNFIIKLFSLMTGNCNAAYQWRRSI